MPKLTRAERHIKTKVDKAKRILKLFYDKNDLHGSAVDCLADIMHMCERENMGFHPLVLQASNYYQSERDDTQQEYDEYYNICETANKIPLTFDGWHDTKR